MDVCHFLLVYDLNSQRLVDQKVFNNVGDAVAAYAQAERDNLADDSMEIVLVGADSIDTVMHTHGSYFDGKVGPRSKYLVQLDGLHPT